MGGGRIFVAHFYLFFKIIIIIMHFTELSTSSPTSFSLKYVSEKNCEQTEQLNPLYELRKHKLFTCRQISNSKTYTLRTNDLYRFELRTSNLNRRNLNTPNKPQPLFLGLMTMLVRKKIEIMSLNI